jgi:hypothetical protein
MLLAGEEAGDAREGVVEVGGVEWSDEGQGWQREVEDYEVTAGV